MATILAFPSSRTLRAVRVEREIGGLGGWIVIADAIGEIHGDFASALRDAREMAAGFGSCVISSAGRLLP
jgi:hypothetical protein